MRICYLLNAFLDSDVRWMNKSASHLKVTMDGQRFLWLVCIDTNTTLKYKHKPNSKE